MLEAPQLSVLLSQLAPDCSSREARRAAVGKLLHMRVEPAALGLRLANMVLEAMRFEELATSHWDHEDCAHVCALGLASIDLNEGARLVHNLAFSDQARALLLGGGLVSSLVTLIDRGDGEHVARAIDILRVLVAQTGEQLSTVVEAVLDAEAMPRLIRLLSTAAVHPQSAAYTADVLRVLDALADSARCRAILAGSRLPTLVRSLEATRGLSGQEASLCARLLARLPRLRA